MYEIHITKNKVVSVKPFTEFIYQNPLIFVMQASHLNDVNGIVEDKECPVLPMSI